ncbi:flagellar biosynthetic protein FlhB [Kineosphaera limosa]|uniref:Putative flagellar biosynthetic protein FlhB n=1 Tax=Kineosphaera limosa NBRC 100340 TaxID=1184609 RepID=K6WQ06_9MICO|nr:EscU/YscU/HrcU family type III secretion system export apparatus switch protein [Kineosphaera limosa]NYD99785.1 flagellar biosynthetic protein FlhB [Kineosphaera limosa]GAB95886.1 putative flagellar biosynthetic protein FlhB [Kineosphaera limosa NBRC 100340]
MSEDKSSKTEKATPQKQKQAKEEGNIARTQDLSMWLTVLVFVFIGPMLIRQLFDDTTLQLEWITRIIEAPDLGTATQYFRSGLLNSLKIILPIALLCMVFGALGHIVQGGMKIYAKRFKPKWKKLNPWTGLKNMFGMQAAWTFVKTLVKFAVFGSIAYFAVQGTIATLSGSGRWAIGSLFGITADTAMAVVRDIAIVGLVIAAADYAMERRRVDKSIRMSKDEIRRESKQQEGDPHVKGQRRAKQREMGRMRMMAAVGEASVVVTNPAHIAVALKYEQGEGAPQVVAKGAGHLAKRIREEAQAHEVPVVRDVIVARMLFKLCEVEEYIPFELYDAIANVLAFVMRMSDLQRTDRVHTSPLRHPDYNGVDLPEDLSDEALGITAYARQAQDEPADGPDDWRAA